MTDSIKSIRTSTVVHIEDSRGEFIKVGVEEFMQALYLGFKMGHRLAEEELKKDYTSPERRKVMENAKKHFAALANLTKKIRPTHLSIMVTQDDPSI